ncbi:uncharacterized protein METZ01_LOCUS417444, partial [marine metagenome]
MITYDVADSGYVIKNDLEANNYLGGVGAYFSSFVIYFFGLASYFFPLFFLVYGLNLIDVKDNSKPSVQSVLIKFVAFLCVLLSTCCLSSMHIYVSWVPMESGAGGIIGKSINEFLIQGLDEIGTTLFSSAIWIIFMPIFIGFSWLNFFRLTGKLVITFVSVLGQFFTRVFTSLKKLIGSFEKKKTKKAIKEREIIEVKEVVKSDPEPKK